MLILLLIYVSSQIQSFESSISYDEAIYIVANNIKCSSYLIFEKQNALAGYSCGNSNPPLVQIFIEISNNRVKLISNDKIEIYNIADIDEKFGSKEFQFVMNMVRIRIEAHKKVNLTKFPRE